MTLSEEVTFPDDMVGDFVILRSNGLPVYNFCCVIDDWLMKMTHVIGAEDHLPNTMRQVMIYEALAKLPEFARVSLLVDADGVAFKDMAQQVLRCLEIKVIFPKPWLII